MFYIFKYTLRNNINILFCYNYDYIHELFYHHMTKYVFIANDIFKQMVILTNIIYKCIFANSIHSIIWLK